MILAALGLGTRFPPIEWSTFGFYLFRRSLTMNGLSSSLRLHRKINARTSEVVKRGQNDPFWGDFFSSPWRHMFQCYSVLFSPFYRLLTGRSFLSGHPHLSRKEVFRLWDCTSALLKIEPKIRRFWIFFVRPAPEGAWQPRRLLLHFTMFAFRL